jgi:ABC-2 type transport system permease protein
MMRIQNITALFQKQSKDVFKNLPVLVLFIVYPIIALIMTQAMKDQAGTADMFVSIFATMHCVFTPIVSTASIISEEKETNTLRVLIMSNVTLREYLFSIGGFILIATLLTGSSFLFISGQPAENAAAFLLSLGIGTIISVVLGSCIGLFSKNASAASGMAVPFGMVFAFLPMLANFNKGIEAVSRFTYGQQVSYLMAGREITAFGIVVPSVNFIVLIAVAAVLFKKSLSEE